MFQKAFDSKMMPSNPVQDIKLPARDYAPASNNVEKDLQCISVTQSETFFKACKDTRYYELFYLLIHTGMRIGEACALTWTDIDFDNKLIHINKTLNQVSIYYDNNGNPLPEHKFVIQITTPKQTKSCRNVPLSEQVSEALLMWKAKQTADKKQCKYWGDENSLLTMYPDLVFTTCNGKAYTPNDASKECRRIMDKINANEKNLLNWKRECLCY